MSSLGTVLNAFIAAAVGGICVSGLFKRGRERKSEPQPEVGTAARNTNAATTPARSAANSAARTVTAPRVP